MHAIHRRLCVLLLAAAVLLAGQALAQTGMKPGCKEDFQTADRSGDSRVDRGEFYARVVETFFLLDKGKKGYLVQEEIVNVRVEAFRTANRKGDGKLTLQEFVNARFVDFAAADGDKDGMLTIEEIVAYGGC